MAATQKDQHRNLVTLADKILRSVYDTNLFRSGEFARLRLAFARNIKEHCDDERAVVQEAAAKGHICPNTVISFERDLNKWRADLAECNGEWPTARASADPDGFARRFKPLVLALREYIAREERDILTIIEKATRS